MENFSTRQVKNIALLGHAGSGKTTLAECMLYEAGLLSRRGTVEEHNTVSDYQPIEQERGSSIFATPLHTEWKGYKINILDTPGNDDFVGEVISSLKVADTGVMLLNAAFGVEVGTDILWEYTEAFKTPMIFVVNQADHDKADFDRTVEQAKSHFSKKVTVVQYPLETGPNFNAIIDVLKMTMYKFPADGGKPEKLPIPTNEKEKADQLHNELIEAIAENDEGLMEKYFEKGSLDEDEMRIGLKKAMINHDLFPLFCLSAKKNMGSGRLMGFIDNVCPSADEMPAQKLTDGNTLKIDSNGQPCIFIFKTVSEAHLGDMSFFKVYSGEITAGMELVNEETGAVEKFTQLFTVEGKKRESVTKLVAGDIGATIKLRSTHTNNTLHAKGQKLEIEPIQFPNPRTRVAIISTKKGEEEKLAQALHQLQEEDPSLRIEVNHELKQTILHCQGEMHLAIIHQKLAHQYKISVDFQQPRIPYRETIQKPVQVSYKHKKQSGGAGQFAEVYMQVEPYYEGMPEPKNFTIRGKEETTLPWGGKLVFYNCIVGGVIDQRFLPSIMKGILEKMENGPLTGSYVRDVRVCVYDGKMHPVDSNDMAFKIAGMMAFKQAFQEADPRILEPVYDLEILSPEEVVGDVMGELPSRRAIIEGIDTDGHYQKIKARIPLAELGSYSSSLRAITQGRAKYSIAFNDYA
ncbi:MAG: elongation factor G, partial [Bacteroidia bacterium]